LPSLLCPSFKVQRNLKPIILSLKFIHIKLLSKPKVSLLNLLFLVVKWKTLRLKEFSVTLKSRSNFGEERRPWNHINFTLLYKGNPGTVLLQKVSLSSCPPKGIFCLGIRTSPGGHWRLGPVGS
jgi:hypothetical protein